jgi:hypothetical protein
MLPAGVTGGLTETGVMKKQASGKNSCLRHRFPVGRTRGAPVRGSAREEGDEERGTSCSLLAVSLPNAKQPVRPSAGPAEKETRKKERRIPPAGCFSLGPEGGYGTFSSSA